MKPCDKRFEPGACSLLQAQSPASLEALRYIALWTFPDTIPYGLLQQKAF